MKNNKNSAKKITALLAATLVCVGALGISASCSYTPAPPKEDPTELKLNLLENPMGVKKDELSFGWVMNDNDMDEVQTAYRLVIAQGADKFQSGEYTYDSDWVESSQNTAVKIEGLGEKLLPASLYYWAVKTKDKDGSESNFSVPQAFYTAMETEWTSLNGVWAGNGGAKAADDFAFLRTVFSISDSEYKNIDRAVLSVTARSPEPSRQFVYNAYLNGQSVGVGPSRYGKGVGGEQILYYNSYDVTNKLVAGDNALGAICYTTSEKLFLCQLDLFLKNGTKITATNSGNDSENWKSMAGDGVFGKNNSIGTDYYFAAANNIDSSLYPFGFDTAQFDDGDWTPCYGAGKIDYGMTLVPSQIDGVNRFLSDRDKITVTEKGDSQIVDLGCEIVGGLRLEFNSPFESEIELRYGEQLNEDGSVKYKMLTGNTYREVWKIKSGYQCIDTIDMLTYRYVEIINLPVALSCDMVCGLEIRCGWTENEYSFDSDNTYLNDMYALVRNTAKVTTQDLFVDSQSRERRAYEGDCVINMPCLYAFQDDYSVARFSAEYLYTNRTWPADYVLFCSEMALTDYMTTGDISSLVKYYDILKTKTFTKHLNGSLNLLTNGGVTQSSSTDCILVDWPQEERDGYDMDVTYNTVFNALAAASYRRLAQIAEVTGHTQDASEFSALAEKVRLAMIDKLYAPDKGAFADGCGASGTASNHFSQHATAFALACGIYSDAEMASNMAAYIESQGKIRMSVYGSYFLLKGLYESNNGKVANSLLLDDDVSDGARTWAYMMYKLGATVTTEAWNPVNKDNMTFSHPWGGAPAYAITGGIFGIKPTKPAYETFEIKFNVYGLSQASVTMPTARGKISASFKKGDTEFYSEVTVPANTIATVYLPSDGSKKVYLDGAEISGEYSDGFVAVKVGSGKRTVKVC